MRESDLLGHIYQRSTDLANAFGEVLVGPGDDCAVIDAGGEPLLITVDQVIERRHFEPDTELDLIARKAVARSVSDIAAMGGSPVWGLATAVLPDGYQHADALFDAMNEWARHWGCPLVGGDIASSPGPLSLTVTVAGKMDGHAPVLRSGAKPGDAIWVTGQIGGSFESGWHLRFDPRLEAGRFAASRHASAMIDLSDGLGRDAARVGVASGVRLEIDAAKVPISHRSVGWREACAEGEDYELLVCGQLSGQLSGWLGITPEPARIGRVVPCEAGKPPGAVILDPHGQRHDAKDLGWDH